MYASIIKNRSIHFFGEKIRNCYFQLSAMNKVYYPFFLKVDMIWQGFVYKKVRLFPSNTICRWDKNLQQVSFLERKLSNAGWKCCGRPLAIWSNYDIKNIYNTIRLFRRLEAKVSFSSGLIWKGNIPNNPTTQYKRVELILLNRYRNSLQCNKKILFLLFNNSFNNSQYDDIDIFNFFKSSSSSSSF